MNKLTLDENAKQDWLNIVKKHKKKQKGTPALTTLNTDAGDVEKHIEIFNKMSSHTDTLNNNPISGPFGDSVDLSSDGAAMGESCNKCINEFIMDKETVDLYYNESKKTTNICENLDDCFDMSLRSIL